jgi:hypothetical protein
MHEAHAVCSIQQGLTLRRVHKWQYIHCTCRSEITTRESILLLPLHVVLTSVYRSIVVLLLCLRLRCPMSDVLGVH